MTLGYRSGLYAISGLIHTPLLGLSHGAKIMFTGIRSKEDLILQFKSFIKNETKSLLHKKG